MPSVSSPQKLPAQPVRARAPLAESPFVSPALFALAARLNPLPIRPAHVAAEQQMAPFGKPIGVPCGPETANQNTSPTLSSTLPAIPVNRAATPTP